MDSKPWNKVEVVVKHIHSVPWHGGSVSVFLITVDSKYVATVRSEKHRDLILAQITKELEEVGKEVILRIN